MENSKKVVFFLSFAFIAGMIGGLVGGKIAFQGVSGKSIETHSYIENSQIIDSIQKVAPAVVSVLNSKSLDLKSLEIANSKDVFGGTGFIVDSSGLILTNKHVVQDKKAPVKIVLNDKTEYLADFLTEDPFDDIAVLKIRNDKSVVFPVVTFGDSDGLKIGQRVTAIGNALAIYGNTVTAGIISGEGRDVVAYNDFGSEQNMAGLLQTDAAINLGNSGGPLVDLDGEVIGMNTALEQSSNSIGFAIPLNDFKIVIPGVKKFGKIIRPVFGVNFVMLEKSQAHDLDSSLDHGALLVDKKGSYGPAVQAGGAADMAGLKALDVILAVNNVDVTMQSPLQKLIKTYNPGDTLKMKVWRNGKIIDLSVVLRSNLDG